MVCRDVNEQGAESDVPAHLDPRATSAQAGIPDTRRIGGLGEQQRRKLTEALGG